jgi:hydroxylamine reductase
MSNKGYPSCTNFIPMFALTQDMLSTKDHDAFIFIGIARLLDLGQCNDAYSAIVVATGNVIMQSVHEDGRKLPCFIQQSGCQPFCYSLSLNAELAKALKTDVNSLPLSIDLSWFEQKAVAVLLTLLHLGIRNIRLGPR